MRAFPADFLWGASVAAHQVEGGNTGSDWWDWEHDPASGCVEPSGDAIDQRHRYPEDLALIADLGLNAYRLSVEWARIEPEPGLFSRAEIEQYRRVLGTVRDKGLTAFVTLHHFTSPRWFAEQGGWERPDALDRFSRYAERVASDLGDLMPYVGTVNEPQMVALGGWLLGQFPPGRKDRDAAVQVSRTLAEAHRRGVAAVRASGHGSLVGPCLQLPPVEALRPGDEQDEATAAGLRWLIRDVHLDDLRAGGDVGDFVGLQYYTRVRVDATLEVPLVRADPSEVETTQMGWEVQPASFALALQDAASLGLPVLVTENGIATADDEQRRRYLLSHLQVLQEQREAGLDVRGYFHWSAFDNFEWAHGYAPTFGLIGIDREDGLRRVVKQTAHRYGRVARTGSLAPLES